MCCFSIHWAVIDCHRLIMSQLQHFELFPQLPYDIRAQIWKTAFGPRMVELIEENEEDDKGNDDEDSEWNDFETIFETLSQQAARQAREEQLALYDVIEGDNRATGWRKRQTQLEEFGFSSIHPAPTLRRVTWQVMDDETREGRFCSRTKTTALLFVCKESRDLLKSLGYDFAFATRTRPATIWFNFKSDFLCLVWRWWDNDSLTSETIDGGGWNIGQILPRDRRRLQKLALDWCSLSERESALVKGVKMFGQLKELVLFTGDMRNWGLELHSDNEWEIEDEDFEFIPGVGYEFLGSCQCLCHNSGFVVEDEVRPSVESEALAERLVKERDQDVAQGKEYWSVPTVRVVGIVMLEQKRLAIRQRKEWLDREDKKATYMTKTAIGPDALLWDKPEPIEGTDHRPPSPWSVQWADDIEARNEIAWNTEWETRGPCRCYL